MVFKNLFNTVTNQDGLKNIMSAVQEQLDDFPSIRKKVEAFLLGMEFMLYLQGDNDVVDFLSGRIILSEHTLTLLVNRIVEETPGIECVSVIVKDGYILCTLSLDRGPGGMQVSLKLGNLRVNLKQEPPVFLVDLLEFPGIKTGMPLAAFIFSRTIYILKKFLNEERLYRRVLKNIKGLSVQGRTFKYNLLEAPGVENAFKRDFLGVKVVDVFSIDKVELKEGEVRIYGGPRIPEKLISRTGTY